MTFLYWIVYIISRHATTALFESFILKIIPGNLFDGDNDAHNAELLNCTNMTDSGSPGH